MNLEPSADLASRARLGDERALSELFEIHRPRLVPMAELRLDPSLRRRLDAADVVQESWLEIARRFSQWWAQDALPFHVWVRLVTSQTLAHAHPRPPPAHMRQAPRGAPPPQGRPGVN